MAITVERLAESQAPSRRISSGGLSPLFCILALTIVGTLLRFRHLDRESMWFDEGFSTWVAHLDWHSFWKTISGSEANMLLYYLVLRLWTHFGESETLIRSLSALAGSATVPVFFLLCRRMFNVRVAMIGGFFLAVNVYHIAYSQEARGYSFVVLFSTLSALFFVRAIERGTRIDWVLYVVASTLAIYSQIFALLVVGAQWASLVSLTLRDLRRRSFAVAAALIALLSLPLVLNVFRDTGAHLGWISPPAITDLYLMLCEFAALRQGYRLLVIGMFAAVLAAIIFSLRDWRKTESSFQNWHFVLVLSWFVLPISLTFGISQWKPVFADRFLIVSLPPLLVLAALGISRIPNKLILTATLLILSVWQLRCIRTYDSKLVKEDWRGASEYLLAHGTRSDGLIFYKPFCQMPFDYYARLHHRTGEVSTIPPFGANIGRETSGPSAPVPTSASNTPPRTWFVESHAGSTQEIRTIEKNLHARYMDVSEQDFRGMRILLYSGKQP